MTYFHGAFQRLFIEGGMKDSLLKLKKTHEGYRIWVSKILYTFKYIFFLLLFKIIIIIFFII